MHLGVDLRSALAILFIGSLGLTGCPSGSSTSGNGETNSAPAVEQPSGPKSYAASDLQIKIGDPLPPLDEGRIEIARPAGWEVGPRQTGYVAWFHRFKDAKILPQIRITAEDVPADAPQNATKDNAEEFAKWLAGHVKQDLKNENELLEPVKAIVLGENVFGRYVRKGRYRGADSEQHFLVTAHGGRLYSIQQLVLKGDLLKTDIRDAAYAVGAGLKFHEGGSLATESSFQPPGETPTETPAETPPAP